MKFNLKKEQKQYYDDLKAIQKAEQREELIEDAGTITDALSGETYYFHPECGSYHAKEWAGCEK